MLGDHAASASGQLGDCARGWVKHTGLLWGGDAEPAMVCAQAMAIPSFPHGYPFDNVT